jgi:hypothetical protein
MPSSNTCEFYGFRLDKNKNASRIELFGRLLAVERETTARFLEELILAKGATRRHDYLLEVVNRCLKEAGQKEISRTALYNVVVDAREKIRLHLVGLGLSHQDAGSEIVENERHAGFRLSRPALERLRELPQIKPLIS